MYILLTRKRGGYRTYLALITVLYTIATVEIGLKIALYLVQSQIELYSFVAALRELGNVAPEQIQTQREDERSFINWASFPLSVYVHFTTVLANCLMDILLVWRCYLLWGCNKIPVLIFPCLIVVGTNAYGLVLMVSQFLSVATMAPTGSTSPLSLKPHLAIFTFFAFIGNLLLTMLIAGRILLIAYRVGKNLPSRSSIPTVYRTIISATIESGLIYPLSLIVYTACVFVSWGYYRETEGIDLTEDVVFDSLVTIMVISSTLIIVRVTLGIAIHDEKTFKETIAKDILQSSQAQDHPFDHSILNIARRPDSFDSHHGIDTQTTIISLDLEAQKKE
ncbi:hypothetical protein PM082_002359 [Marasmius tenuissimus]|nr:hypothetical protein PM082_002359 [Marasmius tenuissimus]